MQTRQISFAEAIDLSKIEEADFAPFAVINDNGIVNIEGFISEYAKNPKKHTVGAWANDAELAAIEFLVGRDASIEMRGMHTYNKIPATLKFEVDDFNWFINL